MGTGAVSRYKFDRSRETVTVQDFCWGHMRSVAVQAVSKPEISQGAGFKLRTDERACPERSEGSGCKFGRICHGSRVPQKP